MILLTYRCTLRGEQQQVHGPPLPRHAEVAQQHVAVTQLVVLAPARGDGTRVARVTAPT